MTRNLLFQIAYRGTCYHGFQMQKNALSVCGVLSQAVTAVTGERHGIVGCSRTDAGVHAREYYFHMKTASGIPEDAFVRALNAHLPQDIAVLFCREVPIEFHARFCAQQKEYVYQIWNAPVRNPFYEDTALHYKYPLDEALLNRAAREYEGTHDFAAFCSAGGSVSDTVRTVLSAGVRREGALVTFTVQGNGFLYNMVRIMVGTLLEISEGKMVLEQIPALYETRERSGAGRTAPPQGLFLNKVIYDPKWFSFGRDSSGT